MASYPSRLPIIVIHLLGPLLKQHSHWRGSRSPPRKTLRRTTQRTFRSLQHERERTNPPTKTQKMAEELRCPNRPMGESFILQAFALSDAKAVQANDSPLHPTQSHHMLMQGNLIPTRFVPDCRNRIAQGTGGRSLVFYDWCLRL